MTMELHIECLRIWKLLWVVVGVHSFQKGFYGLCEYVEFDNFLYL